MKPLSKEAIVPIDGNTTIRPKAQVNPLRIDLSKENFSPDNRICSLASLESYREREVRIYW